MTLLTDVAHCLIVGPPDELTSPFTRENVDAHDYWRHVSPAPEALCQGRHDGLYEPGRNFGLTGNHRKPTLAPAADPKSRQAALVLSTLTRPAG
jgi:hypothetical protein